MTAAASRLRWVAALAALSAVAVAAGYLVSAGYGMFALMAVGLPALTFVLITYPEAALILAILLMLTVPSWAWVGVEQASVARIAALGALGAALLYARKVRLNHLDGAFAAFILVALVTWQLGPHESDSEKVLFNSLLPAAFYLAARVLPVSKRSKALWAVLAGGAIGAATVIYELQVGHVVFLDPELYAWNQTTSTIFRPGGIFGSPPGAATTLGIAALASVPLFRRSGSKSRALVLPLVALIVFAIALTYTRGGILGLATGTGLYLWLTRSRWAVPVPLLCGTVAVATAVLLLLPQIDQSPLIQQGLLRSGTFAHRESLWELAIPIATTDARSILVGKGAFITLSGEYGGSIPAELGSAQDLIEQGTHNQYVLHFLEQGLLGLGALVAWLGLTFLRGLRLARRSSERVAAALTAALLSFSITLTVGNGLLHSPSFALAAFVSGLIASASLSGGGQPSREPVA